MFYRKHLNGCVSSWPVCDQHLSHSSNVWISQCPVIYHDFESAFSVSVELQCLIVSLCSSFQYNV